MSLRVHWKPPADPTVTSYDVSRAASATGTFVLLGTVDAARTAANWDGARYFYDDPDGTAQLFYRVQGYAGAGYLAADSGVFQPSVLQGLDLGGKARVDHDFGAHDALRYTASGVGVPQATIRVWRKADFDAGRTDLALAVTETDATGRWVTPVFLDRGMTYVVQFYKPSGYGPDKVEIVV